MSLLDSGMLARLREGDSRWLVGVSGGGDSVALVRLLVEAGLRERIVVGNFNHGWSDFGAESAAFVEGLAKELGVEYRHGAGKLGKPRANPEGLASMERYEWFYKLAQDEDLAGLVIGHTLSDVAETFLMRAGKGSGLQGFANIRPVTPWMGDRVIVRPLAGVHREALRVWLLERTFEWLEDLDNLDGGSQRAKLRKLLPALEMAGIKVESIAASVLALQDAEEVVLAVVKGFPVAFNDTDTAATVELEALRRVETETAVRVMARMMRRLVPEDGVVRRSKRVALLERLRVEDAGHATLGGLKFEWKKGQLKAVPEKGE